MKRSYIAMLVSFFVLIPATLFLGGRLPGRGYYITAVLMIAELLVPFLLAFEGRRPKARELVVISIMCAAAVIGRVAVPIPAFKPVFAIIMLTGIAFGPETGFIVGAVTALVSNFFFGQGVYMPWQMMAYGAGGMAAGFFFKIKAIPRKRWVLALFGALCVIVWVGPLLDSSQIFLMAPEVNRESALAALASGFPVNLLQATCTALVMFVFGKALLEKLDRVKIKYGMTEGDHGI